MDDEVAIHITAEDTASAAFEQAAGGAEGLAAALERAVEAMNTASEAMNGATEGMHSEGDAATDAADKSESFFSGVHEMAMGLIEANVIEQVADQVKDLVGSLISAPAAAETLTNRLAILAQNTPEYAAKTAGMTSETEKWQVAMDLAGTKVEDLSNKTMSAPFSLEQLGSATAVLARFGLQSDETAAKFGTSADAILSTVENVSAGTGLSMDKISKWMGDFATGKAQPVISQMEKMGVVTQAQLDAMGIAFDKHGKMTTPVEEAMPRLLAAIDKTYGNATEHTATTFDGMTKIYGNWLDKAAETLGKPIFAKLEQGLSALMAVLTSSAVMGALTWLGDMLGNVIATSAGLVGDAFNLLVSIGQALGGAINTLIAPLGGIEGLFNTAGAAANSFLAPIQAVANAIIGPLKDAFSSLMSGNFSGFFSGIESALSSAAGAILNFASTAQESILGWLISASQNIVPMLGGFYTGLYNALEQMLPGIISWAGQMLFNYLDWATQAASNIIPMVGQFAANIVNGLATLVQQAGPMLVTLASNFLGWIGNLLPELGTKLGEYIGVVIQKVGEWAGQVGPALLNLAGTFIHWITNDAIPNLLPALVGFAGKLVEGVGNFIGAVAPHLLELAGSFVNWLGQAVLALPGKLVEWTGALLSGVGSTIANLLPKLAELGVDFWNWLVSILPALGTALGNFAQSIWDWLTNLITSIPGKFVDAGKAMVTGIWNGISGAWDWLTGGTQANIDNLITVSTDRANGFAAVGQNMMTEIMQGSDAYKANVAASLTTSVDWTLSSTDRAVSPSAVALGGNLDIYVAQGVQDKAYIAAQAVLNTLSNALAPGFAALGIANPLGGMAVAMGSMIPDAIGVGVTNTGPPIITPAIVGAVGAAHTAAANHPAVKAAGQALGTAVAQNIAAGIAAPGSAQALGTAMNNSMLGGVDYSKITFAQLADMVGTTLATQIQQTLAAQGGALMGQGLTAAAAIAGTTAQGAATAAGAATGAAVATGIAQGVTGSNAPVLSVQQTIANAAVAWNAQVTGQATGTTLATGVATGITNTAAAPSAATTTVVNAAATAATAAAAQFVAIGVNIIDSIKQGALSMQGQLSGTLVAIVQSAVSAAKAALGIASPSSVGIAIGENFGLSIAQGADSTNGAVSAAFKRILGGATIIGGNANTAGQLTAPLQSEVNWLRGNTPGYGGSQPSGGNVSTQPVGGGTVNHIYINGNGDQYLLDKIKGVVSGQVNIARGWSLWLAQPVAASN